MQIADKLSRNRAIHRAAQSVARAHIGRAASLSDSLTKTLAGPMAEAKYSKRALVAVLLNCDRQDSAAAQHAFGLLVAHGFADDAIPDCRKAENRARQLLRERWPAIERVAAALQARGTLGADELRSLVAYPADQV